MHNTVVLNGRAQSEPQGPFHWRARAAAPDLLDRTKIVLPATVPFGSQVAFRARLSGLSAQAAAEACARLTARGSACITVPPTRDSF